MWKQKTPNLWNRSGQTFAWTPETPWSAPLKNDIFKVYYFLIPEGEVLKAKNLFLSPVYL